MKLQEIFKIEFRDYASVHRQLLAILTYLTFVAFITIMLPIGIFHLGAQYQ